MHFFAEKISQLGFDPLACFLTELIFELLHTLLFYCCVCVLLLCGDILWLQDVADLSSQFPELSGDIRLPIYCSPHQLFSSVLRIGSPGIQLWTHYDVRVSFS